MGNLEGQTAIISGALGDIGGAIARELAGRGAAIALGDILEAERSCPMLEELAGLGVKCRYDRVDVCDEATVTKWVSDVEGTLGTPTLIIPNAAIVTIADFRSVTAAQWKRELDINLNGAFHLAQAGALRLLDGNRPGRIVFIGSWAAHAPHTHIPAYAAAKAGLRMLMKCMALDLAPEDILVNEVAPGYVDAGLTALLFREMPGRREKSIAKVPIGRLIEPRDVAFQVAHLCDPENRHTTGTALIMDGGLSLLT